VTTPRWLRRLQVVLAPLALFGAAGARADTVAESVGDGIVRFWPDAAARDAALPSLSLAAPLPALGAAPEAFPVRPVFRMERGGRVVRLAIARGTTLYGTGEVPGPLVRNGRTTTCWNTDAYAYGGDSPSLYQSHPWVLAVRADGSAFGVLADTPGRIVVDLSDGIEFRAQGPAFAVIVIDRPSPQEVVRSLADLTGHMPLPPRWALGFQQCRYSYAPASEVLRIAREFRARRLPCDVLWMDIDYMDRHQPFTFDPLGFADPAALSDTLHALGFRSVWILDPGIRRQPGDPTFDEGTRGDVWVKLPDGTPFTGRVWPGPCVFPDFTRAETRAWWGRLTADFAARAGADGIWNDMNEPAVFDVREKSMPETARHEADPELGGPGYHARYHNVYGMLMARSSWEGLHAARPGRRPFVLSRANHLGGQRWAAAWTGDNRATDEHFRMALPMVLNLGLSGQPFAGPDIGGFAGACTGEEYAAWMGLGTLLPFSRAHTEKGNIRKEPWSFGPRIEALARRALETRYTLLPYLYTVFEEAARTGLPVARPAFFADPKAAWLRGDQHEFLLGGDLLVHVGALAPAGGAPSLADDAKHWPRVDLAGAADPALPTLHVRAGAIVPTGPQLQFTGERPGEAQTKTAGELVPERVFLLVAPDEHGHAEGWLYEDSGDGEGYRNGEFRRTHFVAETVDGKLRVNEVGHEGAWPAPANREYRISIVGGPEEVPGSRR
jgi:alpha-glucosidase